VPRVIRTGIVAIVSLLALVFASSAAAAGSQGATVINVNDCQPVGDETLCSTGQIVFNTTATPSGLLSTTFHDNIRQSYTGGPCTTQVHDHTQMHHLNDLTDGTTQEDSIVARESFVFACERDVQLREPDHDPPGQRRVPVQPRHIRLRAGMSRS
jgi:hypothetical protein